MDLVTLLIVLGFYGTTRIVVSSHDIFSKLRFIDETIVGGRDALIEDHPYQVFFCNIPGMTYCGGFIISENYILTAAHCTEGVNPSSVEFRVGSSWFRHGTIIPISEVITNPEYNDITNDKDVGILKTAIPIQFTQTIQSIKLPPKGMILADDSMVTITGWGQTIKEMFHQSEHLLVADIPVVNFAKCKESYEHKSMKVTENMWCAGNFVNGGKSACHGDSGGAAVQNGMAVGIVSFSYGCGLPGYPTVYTNVASPAVRDFITKHTGL